MVLTAEMCSLSSLICLPSCESAAVLASSFSSSSKLSSNLKVEICLLMLVSGEMLVKIGERLVVACCCCAGGASELEVEVDDGDGDGDEDGLVG